MPVAVGLGHGFDGARAGSRHDEWHSDACCGARSCELTILVDDALYPHRSDEHRRGELDAKEGSLEAQLGQLGAAGANRRRLRQGCDWWRCTAYEG